MKPLVSLVIPVHNFERFLANTIESVKNQTLDKNFIETIVIDDYSKDNSFQVLKNLITNNMRLVKTNKNLKAYGTKNLGAKISKGKYVALLDGDDFLEPNALENTLEFMEKNPHIKYSYSQHRRVDCKGNFICDREGYDFLRSILLHRNIVGAMECFEKDLFCEIGGFRNVYAEDYDFALRASEILDDCEISRNPTIIYNYRIHGDNKSISGLEFSRESTSNIIKESLKRKEKIDANVFWSHVTLDKYNYYGWEVKSR